MSPSHNQSLTPQSQVTPDPLQDATRRSSQFEMQAALIPDENKFEYQSAPELIRIIDNTVKSGSAEEYFLYFHGVTHDHLPELDSEFFSSNLRCTVRFTTENSLQALICRILTGRGHRTLTFDLCTSIRFKVAAIPGHTHDSIDLFGGKRFFLGNLRSKEGYEALGPKTQVASRVWPPAVIEFGYSEALDFLHLDAEWWLINSTGGTKLVILIQLMTDPFAILIECWAMAPPPSHTGTRHAPIGAPTCVQLFNINANGEVTTTSPGLCIPYRSLFNEPNDNAQDVVFTNAELSSFALRMFNLMNRQVGNSCCAFFFGKDCLTTALPATSFHRGSVQPPQWPSTPPSDGYASRTITATNYRKFRGGGKGVLYIA